MCPSVRREPDDRGQSSQGIPSRRDDFPARVVQNLAERAAHRCSNPDCGVLTVRPSDASSLNVIRFGVAAHICAAARGGPRFEESMTPYQRASIDNAIHLCHNCARAIDASDGKDYPVGVLQGWKKWREDQTRREAKEGRIRAVTLVSGDHIAIGRNNVTGLSIQRTAKIQPGTRVVAIGETNVTATKIGPDDSEEK